MSHTRSKIHLHIEQLSLPGYTPAERRAFIAALEQELASRSAAGTPIVSQESVRVNTTDLRPATVARNAVASLGSNGKATGSRR